MSFLLIKPYPTGKLVRNSARHFSSSNVNYNPKIVVAGAGSGGLAVASQLLRSGVVQSKDLKIIDNSSVHYYKPLWTFVGGGLANFNESKIGLDTAIQDAGIEKSNFISASVSLVDPKNNKLILDPVDKSSSTPKSLDYDVLILATGIQINWDGIKGLQDALALPDFPVVSNYSPIYVNKTFEQFQKFKGGKAIFTQPSTPIQCAGAPQKIAYLFEEYLRERSPLKDQGIRDKTKIIFNQAMPKIFAVDKYGKELLEVCRKRNIQVNLLNNLVSIDIPSKTAVFSRPKSTGSNELEEYTQEFDFLHATPPMSGPKYAKESGLTDGAGWVNVNKSTTQHVNYSNIFSLGDVSNLPTSKTAAAAAAESGITTDNVINYIQGKELSSVYHGYTSCPLITGKGSLILAEFSGYTGETQESLPFDQSKESKISYELTRYIIPEIYWKGQLKGLWRGPERFQKVTSLGLK